MISSEISIKHIRYVDTSDSIIVMVIYISYNVEWLRFKV